MLTELEQMEIVEALRKWAAQAPNTPLIGFLDEGELLTPHEVVSEILLGGPHRDALLTILEHGIRREGLDQVVKRFSARPVKEHLETPRF